MVIITILNAFRRRRFVRPPLAAIACLILATPARAAVEPEFGTTLEGHRFTPSEIRIPANVKVRLVIDNRDASAEEFDSHALNREKVVPAKSKVTLFIGPLAPERYPFIGEFNAATAHGEVVAQ